MKDSRKQFGAMLVLTFLTSPLQIVSQLGPDECLLFLDFDPVPEELQLHHGLKTAEGKFGVALEFTTALQRAELPFSGQLHQVEALTIGGWFFPRRSGEQTLFSRGLPEIAPQGERMFPPREDWINFLLGTDQRGFFLGTIHGNGSMPFPHVTLQEMRLNTWNQLVVVKTPDGWQKFYHNGTLAHTDRNSLAGGRIRPFIDTAPGEPVRISMAQGGLVGEVWIVDRELSSEEIAADFQAKKISYHPALPISPVQLREMNSHPAPELWAEELSPEHWPAARAGITQAMLDIFGAFPEEIPPLEPGIHSEEDAGNYWRRKVSIQVQENDRMPAWLLIPKTLFPENAAPASAPLRRAPAVICFYGTTSGAGKDSTVGLSGLKPGSPPARNLAFALDMVEAGFVALAPDYLRDGERVNPGRRPYDTTDFYEQFPDWSAHGKDTWDTMRAVDYLQTLDFVDPEKIGMIGHSYGGHSTLFTAALEPRIRVAVANGPVSHFLHYGMHWGVPKGAGNSQSLPGMRPYVLDHTLPVPVSFHEITALIAPRPLLIGQAAGEQRPHEEENYAAVQQVYRMLGVAENLRYHWYAGDHDFPPVARKAAVAWFQKWFNEVGR